MRRWMCSFLLVLAVSATARSAQPNTQPGTQPCIRLGGDETLGTHFQTFEKLFEQLYAKAGLCVRSVSMTPKRIEQLMRSGELDGDWFRPAEYIATRALEQQILPQAMFGLEARMIWLKETGFSGKPEDMKGLKVGHRAGFRWLETHIPLMEAKPFPIPGGSQVKALLIHRRIDLYATSSLHEVALLEAFGEDADKFTSAYWATEPFYHILHSRHADKIPALNAALRAMHQSGELNGFLTMPGIVSVPLTRDGR
ncbi:MAG: hypothetical protein HWE25_02490 [Alphaproteobacteria bacterium]|nr:hypothetical protein [Alphaproteobacteria bacterium]